MNTHERCIVTTVVCAIVVIIFWAGGDGPYSNIGTIAFVVGLVFLGASFATSNRR